MKFLKGHTLFFIASLAVILPSWAYADVKIQLRNGRSITADNCEESAKGYRCYKMGGEFDINRKDVISIKAASGRDEDYSPASSLQPDSTQPSQGKKAEGKEAASGKAGADKGRNAEQEAEARFSEIRKRKTELQAERENLVREQKQIQEDFKKLPDWMAEDKYDEFNKRNSAFDGKMKKFNEEVERLNQEEKKITEGQKAK